MHYTHCLVHVKVIVCETNPLHRVGHTMKQASLHRVGHTMEQVSQISTRCPRRNIGRHKWPWGNKVSQFLELSNEQGRLVGCLILRVFWAHTIDYFGILDHLFAGHIEMTVSVTAEIGNPRRTEKTKKMKPDHISQVYHTCWLRPNMGFIPKMNDDWKYRAGSL